MFSNLTQGSILYGLETKGDLKLFTAPVSSVTLPRPRLANNVFGQAPDMIVDITATVNVERREFRQVPSNTSIANFGPDAFILADGRESLISYVTSMLQTSRNIVDSVEEHKRLIGQYEKVLRDLNPSLSTGDGAEVRSLQSQVSSLQQQLAEMLALIKKENLKKEIK